MSEALKNEIAELKGTVAPEVKWLKEPYVGTIQIKSLIISEDHKGTDGKAYTGKPFFKFMVRTQSKEDASIVFWRPTAEDTPEKALAKKEKTKKFLDNAGADPSIEDPIKYLQSVIGKKIEAVFKLQEEFFTDQNDGAPRIRTKVIYSYSQKYKEPIIINDISKLTIPLSPEERAKYESAVQQYESMAGKSAPTDTIKTEATPEASLETKSEEEEAF